MATNSKFIIYLEALFAVTVWGANFVATKVALSEASPATIVWLRFGVGVFILGLTVALRRQFSLPSRSEIGYLALVGFLGVTFHQWLQVTGLQTAQATVTAWIVATIPIFSALLGWFFLKERMTLLRVLGIIVAAFGVLLVVSRGNLASILTGEFGTPGDFLILISAVNWAVFSVLSRRGLSQHPPAWMMFYVMLFGWIFTTVWLFTFGGSLSDVPSIHATGWASIFILGVFGSGLAYIAWYDALNILPVTQLNVFVNFEPIVTMVVAVFVLGETINLASAIGAAVTILGVYLVNRKITQHDSKEH